MTVTDHFDPRFATAETAETADARFSIGIESYSPRLTVVRAGGELDLTSRSSLAGELDEALRGESVVLLDLSAVSFMYSGAASVIIDAAARAADRLEIFAPTRPARMVLDALGLATIVDDPRAA